jgi:hypothetical protein
MSRNSNCPKLKAIYTKYCKILNKVTKEAKRQHYGRLVTKSYNKIKAMRNIVEKERGRAHSTEQMSSLLVNNKIK